MLLDLYFSYVMRRFSVSRPIIFISIGLLLLGGFFVLPKFLEDRLPIIPSNSSLWEQVSSNAAHPFMTWQNRLSSWDSRMLHFSLRGSLALITGINDTTVSNGFIPPLQGTITLDEVTQFSDTYASGQIRGSGLFSISSADLVLLSGLILSGGDTTDYLVDISFDVKFLWSGTQSRWYINDLTVTQSGYWYTLPTLTRAYLQEYEKSWISYDQFPMRLQRLLTFSVYTNLAQQTDQHVIRTASGSTQVLVQGDDIGIDATLDGTNTFSGLLKFPRSGLRRQLQERKEKNIFGFILKSYRIPEPLLQGIHTVSINRSQIQATGIWSGSQKDILRGSGSYVFSVVPIPSFSVVPPSQQRERDEIKTKN